ncbi:hypothetical protein B0A55_03630 [Friedmanniomyces simplex]|uniref:DUF7726 domain-containing protein n=1 Tax=Friedmanniomyces simplex TaxID=329884 RepID=A0A4U0XM36_9PEZI|nr:hypothetical protein B0A55_03630 [Friedmanniomyces simplex]
MASTSGDTQTQAQPLQERDPDTTTTSNQKPVSFFRSALQSRRANTVKNVTAKRSRKASSSDDKEQSSKKQRTSRTAPPAADISSIHLEGEADEETPIFDTYDDVRKRMNQALPTTTQAALSRTLTELLPKSKVSSHQLAAFLKFKGPQEGAHNPAFYAAYVYFEKLRISEGKKKSAKREKMEQIWGGRRDDNDFKSWHSEGSPLGGFPRTGSHNAHLICLGGERWRLDQYGEVQISGQATSGRVDRKEPAKR